MTDSLFREGGPHRIRRTGRDQYEMSISIPADADGMTGRECPDADCSPAYFKVKPGTGITEGQTVAYCPYCRKSAAPSDFQTREQLRYARDIVNQEALTAVDRMIRNTLGIGPSGKKRLVDGLISVDLKYKPGYRAPVRRPLEEELRRDLRCGYCGLDHAVFGLATWCPDCGRDVFLQHVEAEFAVIHKILGEVPDRRERLGARAAARDVENALEDVVSIFEAVLKIVTRRHLVTTGRTALEIDDTFRKTVKTRYQSIASAEDTFRELTGRELLASLDQNEKAGLAATFEKRHPITHNLGIVDRRYLDRALSGELEGREVRVTANEVGAAAEKAMSILRSAYVA